MTHIDLPALEGTNPLGFLAALGALAVTARMRPEMTVRLSWKDAAVPTPQLHGLQNLDDIVEAVLEDRDAWEDSVALYWPPKGPYWKDVKLTQSEVKEWLSAAESAVESDNSRSLSLVVALVGQVSVDRSGSAKPTDLHFTAGQQQFLDMARQLHENIDAGHVVEALEGPWRYDSDMKSFKWDVTDDRVYALSAVNPTTEAKLTVPGAEWLALMGMTMLPVVGTSGRTLTPGCDGDWHRGGTFSWPLWRPGLSVSVVKSLLTLRDLLEETPTRNLSARGVMRICRSRITRSAQGGYGSFRPTDIVFDEQ